MARLSLSVPILLVAAAFAAGCGSADPSADRERAAAAFAGLPLTSWRVGGRFQAHGPGHAIYITPRQIALTLQRAPGRRRARAAVPRRRRRRRRAERARPARSTTCAATTRRAGAPRSRATARSSTASCGRASTSLPGPRRRAEVRVPGAARARGRRHPARVPRRERTACGPRRRAADRDRPRRRCRTRRRWRTSEIGGARVPVESRYVLQRRRTAYGFAVGRLRPRARAGHRPGPGVLDASSAARATRWAAAIQVDGAGNAYVTGFTQSPNFPTTAGAFDRTGLGEQQPRRLRHQAQPDRQRRSSTRPSSAGATSSGAATWRSTRRATRTWPARRSRRTSRRPAARSTARSTSTTARAAASTSTTRSSPSSTRRARRSSTRRSWAARSPTTTFGIALDGARNAYVTGETGPANFPTTAGAFDRTANGGSDVFVTKLNADRLGARLLDAARRRPTTSCPGTWRSTPPATPTSAGHALGRLPDDARRVRHDAERRRVRRAVRPVRDQAQRRRLRARLLDVPRRLEERLRRRLRARRGRQRLPGRWHAVAGLPDDAGRVRSRLRRRARGSSPSSTRPGRRSSTRRSSARPARRPSRRTPTATPGWPARSGPDGATTPDAFDLFFNGGAADAYVAEAERDRLGADVRQLPRRDGVRGRQRRRARPGRQRLRRRPHLLGRLPDDARRVRPHVRRRHDDLLGRRVRRQGRRRPARRRRHRLRRLRPPRRRWSARPTRPWSRRR